MRVTYTGLSVQIQVQLKLLYAFDQNTLESGFICVYASVFQSYMPCEYDAIHVNCVRPNKRENENKCENRRNLYLTPNVNDLTLFQINRNETG